MDSRGVLLLNLSNSTDSPAHALRERGWDVRATNSVEKLTTLNARGQCLVGLVIANQESDLSQLERLPALCAIEWIALVPSGLLEDSDWARVLAHNFYDYHRLPADIDRLSVMLGHAYGRCQLLSQLQTDRGSAGRYGMIGRGPAMQALYARLDRIVKVDAPVLITGESGTGKELVAHAIHQYSERREGPFVAVNCGGLAENLIQSELFGHERGAFTGAHQRKTGAIEAAAGGVMFLDEIGDLPLSLQANLLRFLQDKSIMRVGATRPTRVDVRIVAATNVDLPNAVKQGRFREDLFYRLNVVRIETPALRQRGEDIDLLALSLFKDLTASHNTRVRGISSSALAAMRRHSWPGNVRELMNCLLQAMVMSNNRLITPADLGLEDPVTISNVVPLSSARQRFERDAICAALASNNQNVSKTARDLGVSRVTLYRMFEKFDIERP